MTGLIGVVIPVLDDWESLGAVLADLNAGVQDGPGFHVIIVDDGSSSEPPDELAAVPGTGRIRSLEVIRLAVNLGHQRAIAVGLSAAARRDELAAVVVMDGDGEDRPADIDALLAASASRPAHVVLARRARRSEDWRFRLGYMAYKVLFRILTGKVIDFGNFCLLPIGAVRRLVHMPELWNNLAATVIRSRMRTVRVPIDRGQRVAGRSHMNLPGLIVHGLSAMSVYSDLIFVRVLLGALLVGGLAAVGTLAVTAVRVATHYAVPGWASTVFGDLVIILMQTIVMVVATTLIVLNSRSQRPIVPFADAPAFIADRQQWVRPAHRQDSALVTT
ncbi:MAG TPA: glycosyltransferase family 2 protein [Acetobacteraceae bacterium]|nr:glycosyltransferase family 2 protein [Acetobacteraceae bacterium]